MQHRMKFLWASAAFFMLAAVPQLALAQRAEKAEPAKSSAPAAKHDLSGIWTIRGGVGRDAEKPQLTPWGLEKFKQSKSSNSGQYKLDETNDPVITKCVPPGVPRVYYHPFPFEFLTEPKGLLILYEYDHTTRHIYTDGREVPADPIVTYMGTSVGHWLDDTTLEVVTVGQNDKTWLDRNGTPHSDQLKVTERFHRTDMDHLDIAVTMEDPKALAKPWNLTFHAQLRPNWELGELSCSADNADFANFEK